MTRRIIIAACIASWAACALAACYSVSTEAQVGAADGGGGDAGALGFAGAPDGGADDGGHGDALLSDATETDADAGTDTPDAAAPDAGAADAGSDGGDDGGDGGGSVASCGEEWTLTEYLGGHGVNALATNGAIFVAAGECYTQDAALDCGSPERFGGLIMTSADGLTGWTVRQSMAPLSLKDIVYAGGLFVAVGNKKLIVTSPDGITWTQRQYGTPADPAFAAVVHDGAQFVAAGTGGLVQASPDGIAWTDHSTAPGMNFTHLARGGGRFVGVGSGGWAATSTDGRSWEVAQIPGAGNLYSAAYGGGTYIAGGQNGLSFFSADAKTWTPTGSTYVNYWQGGTYIERCGLFVIALGRTPDADNSVLLSTDGIGYRKVFLETTAVHGQLNVHYDGAILRTFGGYTSMHWSPCTCP